MNTKLVGSLALTATLAMIAGMTVTAGADDVNFDGHTLTATNGTLASCLKVDGEVWRTGGVPMDFNDGTYGYRVQARGLEELSVARFLWLSLDDLGRTHYQMNGFSNLAGLECGSGVLVCANEYVAQMQAWGAEALSHVPGDVGSIPPPPAPGDHCVALE